MELINFSRFVFAPKKFASTYSMYVKLGGVEIWHDFRKQTLVLQ